MAFYGHTAPRLRGRHSSLSSAATRPTNLYDGVHTSLYPKYDSPPPPPYIPSTGFIKPPTYEFDKDRSGHHSGAAFDAEPRSSLRGSSVPTIGRQRRNSISGPCPADDLLPRSCMKGSRELERQRHIREEVVLGLRNSFPPREEDPNSAFFERTAASARVNGAMTYCDDLDWGVTRNIAGGSGTGTSPMRPRGSKVTGALSARDEYVASPRSTYGMGRLDTSRGEPWSFPSSGSSSLTTTTSRNHWPSDYVSSTYPEEETVGTSLQRGHLQRRSQSPLVRTPEGTSTTFGGYGGRSRNGGYGGGGAVRYGR